MVNLNNTITFPLGHFVLPDDVDENAFVVNKIKEASTFCRFVDQFCLIYCCNRQNGINIVGAISDGMFTRQSITELRQFFQEKFQTPYIHIFDFVHVVCSTLILFFWFI